MSKIIIDHIQIVGGINCPNCKRHTEYIYVFTSKLPQWIRCDYCLEFEDYLFLNLDKQKRLNENKILSN